jgi:hypothetical protein
MGVKQGVMPVYMGKEIYVFGYLPKLWYQPCITLGNTPLLWIRSWS